jgi:hypothetical protein
MANSKNQPEKVWRYLVNFWMIVIVALMLADFILHGKYSEVLSPISMVYVALLSVYVTTKEYERWFLMYKGHHPGEIGVLVWTAMLLFMLVFTLVRGDSYSISQDAITTYITVIVVFVITKASKNLFETKSKKRRRG